MHRNVERTSQMHTKESGQALYSGLIEFVSSRTIQIIRQDSNSISLETIEQFIHVVAIKLMRLIRQEWWLASFDTSNFSNQDWVQYNENSSDANLIRHLSWISAFLCNKFGLIHGDLKEVTMAIPIHINGLNPINLHIFRSWRLDISSLTLTVQSIVASLVQLFYALYQKEQIKIENRRRVIQDPLTKIPRRWVMDDQESMWPFHESLKQGGLVVGIMDLNKFKPINDTYGHAVWDAVLVHVIDSIIERMEDSYGYSGYFLDVPGLSSDWTIIRIWGDEFCILIWWRLYEKADGIMDIMRNAAKNPFPLPSNEGDIATIQVSASIWYVRSGDYNWKQPTISDLMKEADEEMYIQKIDRML